MSQHARLMKKIPMSKDTGDRVDYEKKKEETAKQLTLDLLWITQVSPNNFPRIPEREMFCVRLIKAKRE
jgi:hypothetical protein